ncbi:glycosyltransferase family 4 protein [Agromyces bauzanensis]
MAGAGAGAPRRIALISSSYAPHFGGVEEHVRQVARELSSLGHVVEVWTVDRGERLGTRVIEGILVRYLPTPLPARSVRAVAAFAGGFPGAWLRWVEAFRRLRPHVLHVQCFGPNGLYALALHRRFGAALVVTSHGETVADDRGVFRASALLRFGLRRAIARAAAVTAPSEFVLDDLRTAYGLSGGVVVPNGVDLGIHGVPSAAGATSGRYLLGVGRLGVMKGFDLLLKAFAVADLDSAIRLVIGGDGPQRESLEELVNELGLRKRVVLVGRLSPQGVVDAMAGALAVVVPSRMEAFGIVALEAWRAGTALIMTNRGGAPEFVRDGIDGLLVDPENSPALADALSRVAGNPALRRSLAEEGQRRVRGFTWRRVAQEYERIYRAVVDDARAPIVDNTRAR